MKSLKKPLKISQQNISETSQQQQKLKQKDPLQSSDQQKQNYLQRPNQSINESSFSKIQTQSLRIQTQQLSQSQFNQELGYDKGNYQIQKIIQRRWNIQKKRFQYKIKWKGYSIKQCTWQKVQNIVGDDWKMIFKQIPKNILSQYQKYHATTQIYDQQKNKVIAKYMQTQKHHKLYSPIQFINILDKNINKQSQKQIRQQEEDRNNIINMKIQQQRNPNKIKQQYQQIEKQRIKYTNNQKNNYLECGKVNIQRVLWDPLKLQLILFIHQKQNINNKRIITCKQLAQFDVEASIAFTKSKLKLLKEFNKRYITQF